MAKLFSGMQVKELVAGILAVVVVGSTMYITYRTFGMVGDNVRMPDAMGLLTLLFGISGVVIGYYFGSAPADTLAARAQQQATGATTEMNKVMLQSQGIHDHMQGMMDDVGLTRRSLQSGELTVEQCEQMGRILNMVDRSLTSIIRPSTPSPDQD